MSRYEFRYESVGGLEYRLNKASSNAHSWTRVTGEAMLNMTPDELRLIAETMDPKGTN